MNKTDAFRHVWVTSPILFVAACLMPGNALPASLVVNPANPNADDAGAASETHPLRTISAAMKRLQAGDRVFIAAGKYREPILLPSLQWAGAPETVIEGDARGRTLIIGSAIFTNWRDAGKGSGRFAAPIGYEPEQVFVDGEPLQQIGGTVFGGYPGLPNHPLAPLFAGAGGGVWPGRATGDRSSMPVNSFHYDKQSADVMIRIAAGNPAGHVIEVAALTRVLSASGVERLVIRNLGFEHSNTTAGGRGGAVQIDGSNVRIENVTIRRADGACLGMTGANHQIISSSFSECGQMGIGGRGDGWRIEDVTVTRNNTRGFNKWWEAGGAKFVGDGGLTNATISRFRAIGNFGDGLWFDYKNHDNRITDSLFASNAGFGLHLEISKAFTVDNNVMIGNRQRGLYVRQTSDSIIAFNLIAENGLDGVAIIDEGQRDPRGETDYRVRNNWVVANVIAWNQIALTMPEPLDDNQSDGNVFLGDASANIVRIGWTRAIAKPDWIAKALDVNSEWIELPKTERPGMDATQPIDIRLKPYWTMREKLRPLSQALVPLLKARAPAMMNRTDPKPGPATAGWSRP